MSGKNGRQYRNGKCDVTEDNDDEYFDAADILLEDVSIPTFVQEDIYSAQTSKDSGVESVERTTASTAEQETMRHLLDCVCSTSIDVRGNERYESARESTSDQSIEEMDEKANSSSDSDGPLRAEIQSKRSRHKRRRQISSDSGDGSLVEVDALSPSVSGSNFTGIRNKYSEESQVDSSDDTDRLDFSLPYKFPPSTWYSYKAIVDREYGSISKLTNIVFRNKANGSLHMVERLKLVSRLENHDGCVNCINFNAKGTKLLSGSDDLNITMWDWARETPLLTFNSGHNQNVFQAKFLPFAEDHHIVSCSRDGMVRLAEFSFSGCHGTRKLGKHQGSAHKLALISGHPHEFLSCGEDALVMHFDIRDDKPASKILRCAYPPGTLESSDRKVPLYSVSTHPFNEHLFAVSGRDQWVRVYDRRQCTSRSSSNNAVTENLLCVSPVSSHCPVHLREPENRLSGASVSCVVYNHDGTELLASYNDEDIYTFDPTRHHSDDESSFVRRYVGHRNSQTVKGVNYFGPRSEFIVSGSDDAHVYLWEHDSAIVCNFLKGDDTGVVNALEPHPLMPFLATSGLDNDVKVFGPFNYLPGMDFEQLRKTMRQNKDERKVDREQEVDMYGSEFWTFLTRLRTRARARQMRRNRGDDDSEASSFSDDGAAVEIDQGNEEGSDSDDGSNANLRCATQ